MDEKQKKILEMQCPSTRRCLERPPELDTVWLNRAIPKEAQVLKEDGSVDLNLRALSAEDKEFYDGKNGMRRKTGSWFENARTQYLESKKGKIDKALELKVETDHVIPSRVKAENAVNAFMLAGKSIKERFLAVMSGIQTAVIKMGYAARNDETRD